MKFCSQVEDVAHRNHTLQLEDDETQPTHSDSCCATFYESDRAFKPWHATKLMDHHLTQMGWRKHGVVVGTRCPCGFKFLYSTTGIDEGYKGLFHSRVYLDKHKIRTLLRFTLFVHVKDWPVGSWARGRHVFISCWISFRARGKKMLAATCNARTNVCIPSIPRKFDISIVLY